MGFILNFKVAWLVVAFVLYIFYLIFLCITKKKNRVDTFYFGIFLIYLVYLIMKCICPIPLNKTAVSDLYQLYYDPFAKYVCLIPYVERVKEAIEFHSISVFKEFILNIIIFIPIGFLYNYSFKKNDGIRKVLLFGLTVSLFIELIQLFISFMIGTPIRVCDINDLINNGIGTIIGYYLWVFCSKLEISLKKEGKFYD